MGYVRVGSLRNALEGLDDNMLVAIPYQDEGDYSLWQSVHKAEVRKLGPENLGPGFCPRDGEEYEMFVLEG